MEPNEKVFRHSWGKIIPVLLVVILFLFVQITKEDPDYFLLLLIGILVPVTINYLTSRVRISQSEISAQNWLGTKSLRWNEIARSSTRGQNLRLHNHDGDVTLTIDSQLTGYPEIVETIFKHCPGLLDLDATLSFSRGVFQTVSNGVAVLFFSAGVILMLLYGKDLWFTGLFMLILGVSLGVSSLLGPRGVDLDGDNLTIRYMFREIRLPAREIRSFSLESSRTKNGTIYFTQVNLENGKRIRLAGFKQGGVMTYHLLKRWHEKTRASSPAFPRWDSDASRTSREF